MLRIPNQEMLERLCRHAAENCEYYRFYYGVEINVMHCDCQLV